MQKDTIQLSQQVALSGRSFKATTELAGTFANVLGNSQFGGIAGQIAQLTERVNAYSEATKAAGASSLALKATIGAAVAIGSFRIGQEIGEWAFGGELAAASASWRERAGATRSNCQAYAGAQVCRDTRGYIAIH